MLNPDDKTEPRGTMLTVDQQTRTRSFALSESRVP